MTDPNYTLIVGVLDRSGSTATIHTDLEEGWNSYVTKQAAEPGVAKLYLVDFDSDTSYGSDNDGYRVLERFTPLPEVKHYTHEPRGMTALWDGVGRTVTEVGQELAKQPEDERPGKVLFVVFTDGQENSSREFTAKQVRELVTTQTDDYTWQFVFLGVGIDAFAEAGRLAFGQGSTLRSDRDQTQSVIGQTLNSYTTRYRGTATASAGQSVTFTDEERKEAEGDK